MHEPISLESVFLRNSNNIAALHPDAQRISFLITPNFDFGVMRFTFQVRETIFRKSCYLMAISVVGPSLAPV